MATAWFGPCPHCNIALSYLQGVTGSTMTPKCPGCRKVVTVTRATFLMADHSQPTTSLRSSPQPKKVPALP
jgi:phage FluMu protein Com